MDPLLSKTNDASSQIKDTLSKAASSVLDAYNNMNDDFASYIIYFIIVIIIICMIYFYSTTHNLQKNNCDAINNLYPSINSNITSIGKSFANKFSDYYINSAYNACSGGNYKNGYVDICNLNAVIKAGVRCFDFAIYNENDTPVVATSIDDNFYVKETYNSIDFAEVMKTLYYNAFGDISPNKLDPIVVHLRIKSNNIKIYNTIAEIFKLYDDVMTSKITSYASYNTNFGNIPINKLLGKIIVIVDGSNNTYLQSESFFEYVNLVSNSNYMWLFKYSDIKNNPDIDDLTDNNKYNATIVLPDGGTDPDNPSAALAREYGCQIVAMRYQKNDSYLEENINYFNTNGYAFVLKPENLREQQVVISPPVPQNPAYSYQTRQVNSNLYSFKY